MSLVDPEVVEVQEPMDYEDDESMRAPPARSTQTDQRGSLSDLLKNYIDAPVPQSVDMATQSEQAQEQESETQGYLSFTERMRTFRNVVSTLPTEPKRPDVSHGPRFYKTRSQSVGNADSSIITSFGPGHRSADAGAVILNYFRNTASMRRARENASLNANSRADAVASTSRNSSQQMEVQEQGSSPRWKHEWKALGDLTEPYDDYGEMLDLVSPAEDRTHPETIPYRMRAVSRAINPYRVNGLSVIHTALRRGWKVFKDDESDDEESTTYLVSRDYVWQRDISELIPVEDRPIFYVEDMGAQWMEAYLRPEHTHHLVVKSTVVIAIDPVPIITDQWMDDYELEEYDFFAGVVHDPQGISNTPFSYHKPPRSLQFSFEYDRYDFDNLTHYGAEIARPSAYIQVHEHWARFCKAEIELREVEMTRIRLEMKPIRMRGVRMAKIKGPKRFGFVRHPARHFPLLNKEGAQAMEKVVDDIVPFLDLLNITSDTVASVGLVGSSCTTGISERADEVIAMIEEEPANTPMPDDVEMTPVKEGSNLRRTSTPFASQSATPRHISAIDPNVSWEILPQRTPARVTIQEPSPSTSQPSQSAIVTRKRSNTRKASPNRSAKSPGRRGKGRGKR